MSSAIPPLPAETEAAPAPAGLSEPQRILNTFISPSKTFEDLRRKSSWFVPWVLIGVFLLIFGVVFVHKVDLRRMVREQIEQSSRATIFEQAPPEQQEAQLKFAAKFTEYTFYFSPIGYLVWGLIAAAILMVIFNFGFEATIPYSRYLAIFFYACLPIIISSALSSLIFAVNQDPNSINIRNPVATNPAYFMDPSNNKFLYGLLTGLDVFRIWVIWLVALGVSINAAKKKVSRGTALTTLLVIYALVVVVAAGLAARG